MHTQSRRRGFTILELLIVIVISKSIQSFFQLYILISLLVF